MAQSLLLLDAIIQCDNLNDHLPQNPPPESERKKYTHKASESVAQLEIDFDLILCDPADLVREGTALFKTARDAGHFLGTDFGQTLRPPPQKKRSCLRHPQRGYVDKMAVQRRLRRLYKRPTDLQTLCEHTATVVAKAKRDSAKRKVLAGENSKYTLRCDMEFRKAPFVIPMEAWIRSAHSGDGDLGAGERTAASKRTAANMMTAAVPSINEQQPFIAHGYQAGNYQMNDSSNPDVYLQVVDLNTRVI
ncbi:hypothetical protein CSAL01_13224 [Colletotrichum salicis]|uniref:Uncharacterized protein n=1 Tax=Colletotrichum salicis TaxID=1209931 RepID=A0A135TGK9_9PEZI|nr:hypothetical protein CSAL01_13224 [Colletotrichum salicis]